MTAAKFATAIVILSIIGHCHAQENSILQPLNKGSVAVATQINSRNNYALLQPIANKTSGNNVVRRQLGQMLQPIANASNVANSTAGDVVVLPHSFRKGVFDQHQFMVRNDGSKSLNSGKVLLMAPVGSTIQQVVPKPDSVSGLNVEVSVGELAPGEHEIVEVAIKYPRNEMARFETKIVSRNWAEAASSVTSNAIAKTGKMLTPRSTGMLKPTVPVMTVSATTNRAQTTPESGVSGMLVPSLSEEVEPLELEIQRSESQTDNTVSVQEPPAPTESVEQESVDWAATIEASLHGPKSAVVGEEVEFSIEVDNRSSDIVNGVIVQLSVPEQMKVTVLDRAAWYDAETRKVSWEITELGPGETESIRYKAIVKTGCSIEQVVVTGAGGRFQCKSTIQTTAN